MKKDITRAEAAAEWVDRTALKPWDKNPRNNADNVKRVMESIKRFGFAAPILARKADGEVIAGHTRLLAAEALGMERVPVRYLDLDPGEAHMLAIADNRLTEKSEWDNALLMEQLDAIGLDNAELVGFDSADLDELAKDILREASKDEVAEVADVVKAPKRVELGEVWKLGRHTIVCGDSTTADAWRPKDVMPCMMVTDPPYGVQYKPDWSDGGIPRGNKGGARGEVLNDDRASWKEVYERAEATVAYVWHADKFAALVMSELVECGFSVRAQIVWNKDAPVMSRGHYNWKHEPCWYVVADDSTAEWIGDKKQHTVWDIPKKREDDNNHSTSKPLECMARPIRNHGFELIVDPFLGSGTTLLAAEQLARKCFGIELNPEYCDIVIERWERLTGQTAVKVGSV